VNHPLQLWGPAISEFLLSRQTSNSSSYVSLAAATANVNTRAGFGLAACGAPQARTL